MFDDINKHLSISINNYISQLQEHPWQIVTTILDLIIVGFLIYILIRYAKKSKIWQLVKGIVILIIVTLVSGWLKLNILNMMLNTLMTYGVIALLIIFQPELRRGLETLGSNKFSKMFGINQNIASKTKEDIYMSVIAAEELSKNRVGGLIVFERDIKIQEIIDTGVSMDAEVSPQLLVNIFVPNTPLHDGAVVISNNRIKAVACLLPLADDKDIARELGTRHRAAIGISKESDAIAVVISEETGKISIAKDGTLIVDVSEDALKRILLKNLVYDRYGSEEEEQKFTKIKTKFNNGFKKHKNVDKKIKSDKLMNKSVKKNDESIEEISEEDEDE